MNLIIHKLFNGHAATQNAKVIGRAGENKEFTLAVVTTPSTTILGDTGVGFPVGKTIVCYTKDIGKINEIHASNCDIYELGRW